MFIVNSQNGTERERGKGDGEWQRKLYPLRREENRKTVLKRKNEEETRERGRKEGKKESRSEEGESRPWRKKPEKKTNRIVSTGCFL